MDLARSWRSAATSLTLFAALRASRVAGARLRDRRRRYFKTQCLRCHGPDKQEGEFRIDRLSINVGAENTPHAAEVRERISPARCRRKTRLPAPNPTENARVVEWLTALSSEGEAARLASRGRLLQPPRRARRKYVHYRARPDRRPLRRDRPWAAFWKTPR